MRRTTSRMSLWRGLADSRGAAAALGLCAVAGLCGTAAGSEGESRVRSVVIYPDRAQVTRAREVECGERVAVVFSGLPPAAEVGSLRAAISSGRVEGLRSEVRPRAAAFAREVEQIDEDLHRLGQQQQQINDARARGGAQARVAQGYGEVAARLVSREMSEAPAGRADAATPDVAAWRVALDGLLQARLAAVGERVELDGKQRELTRRMDELRERRRLLSASAARSELAAELLVTCPVGQRARVDLSYLVGGAAWSAAHEARLGGDAREEQVELSSYATITQSTGEDWRGAELIVSTAVPRQSATPPELQPLRVYATAREPPRRVLVTREEFNRHTSNTISADPAKPQGGKNSGVRAEDQGLSVQFIAPEPGEVRGDGTPTRVLIARRILPAQVRYRTVPKLLPYVFRVAEVSNIAGYPLLPGPLDAYRRQQFMARYDIERVAAGERFPLSFGLEEGLKVRRQVIEEMEVDRGVLGRARRHRFAYRLEVQSFLGRAEEVELSEHVPVSEIDDVKVALDPRTSGGYELKAADGIVTWRVSLRAGEQRNLELRYAVDVPASYVGG